MENNLLFLILGLNFWLLYTNRISRHIGGIAIQSLLLGYLSLFLAISQNQDHFFWPGVLTLLFKGILVPGFMYYILQKIRVSDLKASLVGPKLSVTFGILIVLLSYLETSKLELIAQTRQDYLPVALSTFLIGLVLMVLKQKALLQVAGLIVMENGLYLLAIAIAPNLPFIIELGILFDILVEVIIMGIFIFRINETFASSHVKNLQNLKG